MIEKEKLITLIFSVTFLKSQINQLLVYLYLEKKDQHFYRYFLSFMSKSVHVHEFILFQKVPAAQKSVVRQLPQHHHHHRQYQLN